MTETQELIQQLGGLSYLGIWFVSLLSNVVIPIPEEGVILALGYLAGTGSINGFILVPIILSGVLASDIIMYTLSKKGNRAVAVFYEKFFAKRIAKRGTDWLGAHIEKVIFFSRFLVQLRFIGPFLAGQDARVSLRKFVTYDLLALIIYVPLYVFLGWYFHQRVRLIIEDISVVRNLIIIAVLALIAFGIFKFIYKLLFGIKDAGTGEKL